MTTSFNYDLHMHSHHSDGQHSPTELVRMCAAAGITHFALTDHDSTEGVREATLEANRLNLKCIPGIELSAQWMSVDIHIVGLNINIDSAPLQSGLAEYAMLRETRARQIATKLSGAGIAHTYDEAKALSDGGTLTRAHFAQVLVNRGLVADFQEAFKRYLGKNKVAYVPTQWISMATAVQWITQAGGIAVIAHPARYRLSLGKLRKLVRQFAQQGGQGIELVGSPQSPEVLAALVQLCRDLPLLGSRGSDFHGINVSRVVLGQLSALPEGVQPVWTRWEANA